MEARPRKASKSSPSVGKGGSDKPEGGRRFWIRRCCWRSSAFNGTLSEEEIENVAAYVVEDIVGGK